MQENERRQRDVAHPVRPGIDEDLARRLDHLSRVDAERVLERAIRIQTHRHSSESFTRDQVHRIARELGLEDSVVDRAIREELSEGPNVEDKGWLVPRRLSDRAVVAGTAQEVDDQVMAWMETEEGLRAVARTGDGIRWEPDRHWLTSTRLAMGSDATKALRGMPEVVHHQTAVGPEEQVVQLDVDSGRIRRTAWGVGAGVAATGLASGAIVAATVGGGSDLAQFAAVAAPGLVLAVGTTVLIAKTWAGSVRRGIARALDGIAHPELHQRAMRRRRRRSGRDDGSRRGTFSRLADEVADAIEDLFD
ncbi:MAG TPA: hypothetical protein VHL52_06820 [Acidimicrobiia bacterium]|nr:hypothetical protein [Acidimicrobiia bacterium]